MKTSRPKDSWQARLSYYTWHLRPPYDEQFDRTHWWKGKHPTKQQDVPRPSFVFAPAQLSDAGDSDWHGVSALYELARRLPLVGELRRKMDSRDGSYLLPNAPHFEAVQFLLRHGLKSWPKLTRHEQAKWQSSIGQMRGVEGREDAMLCQEVTHSSFPSTSGGTAKERAKNIARNAVAAYRSGFRLFAVAQDLSADKAAALMRQQYAQPRGLLTPPQKPKQPKERARYENWLPIISEFETGQAEPKGAGSAVFTRYRRTLERLPFPRPPSKV